MRIKDCYYVLDGKLNERQRKASEYFIDENLTRLFGRAEFDKDEAYVSITPNTITISNNIYGDDKTRDVVIEVFKNGLVCRSRITNELLFGIKRDDNHVVDIYHDNEKGLSHAYTCTEEKFGYTVKNSTDDKVIFDGVMSAVGSRTSDSEAFYLEVFTPAQEKKSMFGKKGVNGFVDVAIDPYIKKLDEYDYLDGIFGVLRENQKKLTEENSKNI